MPEQLSIFGGGPPAPEGLSYASGLIDAAAERELLAHIQPLPFREFEFHGYTGKRRVISFGWRYDFGERTLHEAGDLPSFLLPVRERAAHFAGIEPERLEHALVTEYGPGAAIGWHRDKAVFDDVVGVSLLSACLFRLRRKAGTKWERYNFTAEPRSVYLLRGPARTEWEHSIPAVTTLRYSITFRTLRPPA